MQLVQSTGGELRIEGLQGTKVNGGATFVAGNQVQNVKVRMMEGGSDQFMLQGKLNLRGNLSVRLDAGNVLIEGSDGPVTIGKDLDIHTGAASDVTLRNEVHVGGETTIDSGGTVNVAAGKATLPRFAAAGFSNSLEIDNPYFPLVQGSKFTYEVTEAGQVTENIANRHPARRYRTRLIYV